MAYLKFACIAVLPSFYLNIPSMSKDKGTKNHKKAPADKSSGKDKAPSSYKSEGKNAIGKQTTLEPFIPKPDAAFGGKLKNSKP
jgi:hypothetical protein